MSSTHAWVLASGNRGKLAEFEALLRDTGLDLQLQGDLGIESAEETAGTFLENALLKARHASRLSGLPAIADDSGLVVDALDGAPGVRSARFAGQSCSDADNVAALLAALDGVPEERRTARFHCTIVALRRDDDPMPLVAQGQWEGLIATIAKGQGGFGYDPVFIEPTSGLTAAQLKADVKNRLSHRAQALVRLRTWLGPADR
ncbi:MAG: RdgB/HAM1 family non-canonical purine NTP pyrophosphatase [Betaproteobacteria bacterium]|nr:RdgB/HAM1 family non-canonical purine NTP pyrophosphatase [Betaproteobacteria bacterium]